MPSLGHGFPDFFLPDPSADDCGPSDELLQIADAVAGLLEVTDLCQPFEVVRDYAPVHDTEELDTLKVVVVPTGETVATLARDSDQFDFVVAVAVQKRLSAGPITRLERLAAVDPLRRFVRKIIHLFRRKKLGIESGSPTCINVANIPVFDRDHMDSHKVFTSVISLTFRMGL